MRGEAEAKSFETGDSREEEATVNEQKTTDGNGEQTRTGASDTPRLAVSRWLTIGAPAALLIVVGTLSGTAWAQDAASRTPGQPPTLTRAQQYARHQRLWAACRACQVEAPAGPARAVAVEGAAPRTVSPYGAVALDGLPAVAIVEARIGALTAGMTADGRGVFTDYELVVTRVVQNSALVPVAVRATILVTRPGGEMERDGVRQRVSVAGYPTLAADARVVVTLLAIPDAGSFQELSLRPAGDKGGPQ
jgi:hypothetical protein